MKRFIKNASTLLITAFVLGLSPVSASAVLNPQTGDSNPMLPVIIILLSLAVVGIIVGVIISIISKKKKK